LSIKNKSTKPEKNPEVSSRRGMLSWAVFIPTIIVLLFSLSSAIFPALITRSFSPVQGLVTSQDYVNPFEPGILAAPLIIVNLIVLGIGMLYYKKKIPILTRIINFISNFDLSKKRAIIAVMVLIVIFIGLTAGTLEKEETWVDYKGVKDRLQVWTISDFSKSFEPHVKFLLLSISQHVFGNIRAIPFLTSIALLLLTYFFTKKITGNRFSGIVSTTLLLQSQIFTSYSTTASYDNTWILLYLFSLYLIEKFWLPSPISYFLSIFSKATTVAFLPMSLYFIARSSLSRKAKIYSLGSYGGIIILIIMAAITLKTNLVGTSISFNSYGFWQGFSSMVLQMRFDYIILIFLLPVTVLLFFASRRGILHADSIMIFMFTILLVSPLLVGFTEQTNQPYRFVAISVFFAIGVGILLSKRTRNQNKLLPSTQKPI
jgi:hypothetical protein